MFKYSSTTKGNAIFEYGVAAIIISTISLSIFSTFFSHTPEVSEELSKSIFNKETNTQLATASTTQNSGTSIKSGFTQGTQHVSFSINGKAYSIQNYPTDISKSIETSGSNGSTVKLLSNIITQLSDDILADGEIDEQQYQSIIDLANKSYQISQVQDDLIQFYENNPSLSHKELMKSSVPGYSDDYQATLYSIGLDDTNVEKSTFNSIDDFQTTSNNYILSELIAQNEAIQNDPSLPLELKALMDDLAFKVALSGEMYQHTVFTSSKHGKSVEETNQKMVKELNKSESTSDTICAKGNGKTTSRFKCS